MLPDLDRGLDADRAAVRAAVALLDRADVREARLEVAAGLDAAQVHAVLVGARHVHARTRALLSATTSTDAPTGPMKPGLRAEGRADLLLGRRPGLLAERVLRA